MTRTFRDLPLLRRLDANRSGRLEDADLAGAYAAYHAGRISARELGAAWAAWYAGQRFQPRLVTPHPGDALPSVEARLRGVPRARVDLVGVTPPLALGGYRLVG